MNHFAPPMPLPVPVTRPNTVCVIGAGYVGLTAAACLAAVGHQVQCVESDPARLAEINSGQLPIVEPGLAELVAINRAAGRLGFTASVQEGVSQAQVALLCVGTPPRASGDPDLRQLATAARQLASAALRDLIVVIKSTVPPGTCEAMDVLCAEDARADIELRIVSNPEFLREGRAVEDFFFPDRIVIGAEDDATAHAVLELYPPGTRAVLCDRRSAELIKYAANTFLAVKISFANEIAALCQHLGADSDSVLAGVGSDARIGPAFLGAGPGFGGACLPKDVAGLIATADSLGLDARLAKAARAVNFDTRQRVITTVHAAVGSLAATRIGVLGLTFKPGTDDVRDSVAVAVVDALSGAGAFLSCHDPLAGPVALPGHRVSDPYQAAAGAVALLILTAWPDYARLDPYRLAETMNGNVVIDATSVLDVGAYHDAGLEVLAIGAGIPDSYHPVIVGPLHWALDAALA